MENEDFTDPSETSKGQEIFGVIISPKIMFDAVLCLLRNLMHQKLRTKTFLGFLPLASKMSQIKKVVVLYLIKYK